jgi:hypothetical protein
MRRSALEVRGACGEHARHLDFGPRTMLTLAFATGVFVLFALLLAAETWTDPAQPRLRQYGLARWLVAGNWPAKVGAGLLILGVGALLRYALLNVAVAPPLKLAAGAACAAALGLASWACAGRPQRRALHLALAGAAFGVAFLTAFSAYGLFGYLTSVQALSLLAVVSAATAGFALQARAMSVAVLALTGAFVAPAFVLHDPGPAVVYGYYVMAAALALLLVALRGWRALVHLSFLFTLAGGLFFGFTRGYHAPEHFATMLPLLLALAALHVAMPLAERRAAAAAPAAVDRAYLLLLPLACAAGLLATAPLPRVHGALALLLLAAVWASAALVLAGQRRGQDAAAHALIAGALSVAAALLRFPDLPGPLLGLALSVLALAAAPAVGLGRVGQTLLASLALMFAAMHAFDSIWIEPAGAVLGNRAFGQRVLAAALLGVAAWLDRRRGLGLHVVLGLAAGTWLAIAGAIELARLDLALVGRLLHLALAVLLAALAIAWPRRGAPTAAVLVAALTLAASGFWVATLPPAEGALPWALTLGGATLAAIATAAARLAAARPLPANPAATAGAGQWTPAPPADPAALARDAASTVLGVLPLALLPWIDAVAPVALGTDRWHAVVALTVALTGAVALGAQRTFAASARFNDVVIPVWVGAIALALLLSAAVRIERGAWPFLLEIVAVAALAAIAARRERILRRGESAYGVAAAAGAALLLQAALLRAFGPPGALSALDLTRMGYPALVSLLWAALGAGLTLWSVRIGARPLWTGGAVVLVAAAVKLVMLDFGALGELANIVALIAAGLVFLAVAWFAPLPPAQASARR